MNNIEPGLSSIIPQRAPFIMIDRLLDADENSTRTTLLVRAENILVYDGELSEAGLTENIAQTAAASAGYLAVNGGNPVLNGYVGSIKDLEISAQPKVGDVITTETIIEEQIFGVTIIKGIVKCDDKLMAWCGMKIFIQNQ